MIEAKNEAKPLLGHTRRYWTVGRYTRKPGHRVQENTAPLEAYRRIRPSKINERVSEEFRPRQQRIAADQRCGYLWYAQPGQLKP